MPLCSDPYVIVFCEQVVTAVVAIGLQVPGRNWSIGRRGFLLVGSRVVLRGLQLLLGKHLCHCVFIPHPPVSGPPTCSGIWNLLGVCWLASSNVRKVCVWG